MVSCACALGMRAAAVGQAAAGTNNQASARSAPLREIAPGVHIREGVDEDATAANLDAIANIGFIVGQDAVAVIDPGGSLADGERLRTAIRSTTSLPIRFVLLSHVHPDHIFGAGAFEADHPQFIGHARLPAALQQRGEYYRDGLERILGRGRVGPLVTPSVQVRDHAQIDLGNRVLEITAHPTAHTDCDLSVFDRQTQTLLLSDLLFVRRVPSLDGSLKGWLQELGKLRKHPARRAVPGHGPTSVDWPAGAADLERYLHTLRSETRTAISRSVDISRAANSVAQSERSRWQLFDDYNGHNVTQAYKELEWE
jgi:quinoprotein relay system zinc metallohydrolase 2